MAQVASETVGAVVIGGDYQGLGIAQSRPARCAGVRCR